MLSDAIEENNRRFAAALAAGDAAGAASVYTDDAALLPPNAEALRGKPAIECFWQGGIAAGISSAQLETLELEETTGRAYEIGRYTLRIEQDGCEPESDVGKYVVVHKRQPDGSWRWAVDIFNSDSPSGR
jgi:ketosteroid isomerase-like protein